jgi:hypothetical protein
MGLNNGPSHGTLGGLAIACLLAGRGASIPIGHLYNLVLPFHN